MLTRWVKVFKFGFRIDLEELGDQGLGYFVIEVLEGSGILRFRIQEFEALED